MPCPAKGVMTFGLVLSTQVLLFTCVAVPRAAGTGPERARVVFWKRGYGSFHSGTPAGSFFPTSIFENGARQI